MIARRIKDPIKKILVSARGHWDRHATPENIRDAFNSVLNCGTAALGAEVYASEHGRRVVYHTCKSSICPSCGWRRNKQWQLEMLASLPDVLYSGITFTMPDVLWTVFRENPDLLHDLPALGADAISRWVKSTHNARALISIIPQTFNGALAFNCHLHCMVSASVFNESENRWISDVLYLHDNLMRIWRYGVITSLRTALAAGTLRSALPEKEIKRLLTKQYERWWSVYVQEAVTKKHFIKYAGRYVRRPPIAMRKFLKVTGKVVQFEAKVYIEAEGKHRVVTQTHTPESFVDLLAQHVMPRYKHAVRHFGLLSPRSKGRLVNALFLLLGQAKRPKPVWPGWAASFLEFVKRDPLLDSRGGRMVRVSRLRPLLAAPNSS